MRTLTSRLATVGLVIGILASGPSFASKRLSNKGLSQADSILWPAGTEVLRFENIEGIILLRGTMRGRLDADTTGPLALDTGAGYLALDLDLARTLGVADSSGEADAVGLAAHPLPRLTLGDWSIDQVAPVLTVDGEVIRRVSDRPVLGLLGQRPLRDRAVWIDYRAGILALIPAGGVDAAATHPESLPDPARELSLREAAPARSLSNLAAVLSARAIPVRFTLIGDGKMLVRGAVADPFPPDFSRGLNLLIDTGATKCVLFEDVIGSVVRYGDRWPALRGLTAPTLIGAAPARIARIPSVEIESVRGRLREPDVDVGVIRSDLSQVLSRVTGETIHGLIGYSFLKRFRVIVDYPNSVMWLDPIPGYRDDRPLEYCHVGLQLERQDGVVVVMGVVEGSPAARAGIAPGDEVVTLDGASAQALDLLDLTRRMEGQPGRPLTLVIRRNAVERSVRLVRRRLL